MPLSAGSRLGCYEILAPLGAGGMGEVYRATDTKLNRDVAIKVLPAAFANDSDRMARFEREAQVLASLNHPHIAAIYGLQESDGMRALVMELVEGPTLGEQIGGRAMALEEALPIAKQIAEALEYAHEKGIIHRDLKPANVKLTTDGHVKVLDFGLAKALEAPAPAAGNPSISPTLTIEGTRAGMILGTAAYMSPEQARGKAVDKRADIWSFGVVLYEMLTGKQPFAGATVSDTLAAVVKTEPDWEQVPPKVRRLLQHCLEKEPKKRLHAIGDFDLLLEQSPQPARKSLLPWAIAASALAALALVLSLTNFGQRPPQKTVLRYTISPPENSTLNGFAISPDGQYLAVAAAVNGKRQLWLRAMDGLQFHPMPGTDDATFPFWSPDSRYIGFFAQLKLKKIAASGGPALSLCDAGIGGGATWSTEDVILFSTASLGGWLQRVKASGGVPSDVRKAKETYAYPTSLRGGRFLYNLAFASQETDGIYLSSLDGGPNRRILADASSAIFAPSARGSHIGHLLFRRENNLMAQPFDATSGQLLGEVLPVAEGVTTYASAPRQVAAAVSETGVLVYMSGEASAGSQMVWYDRAGKVIGLVGRPGVIFTPAISPDEKSIAYSRRASSGAADIWLRDLSRGIETRFTTDPSGNYAPIWSPSSDRIVWVSSQRGSLNLYEKSTGTSGQGEPLLAATRAESAFTFTSTLGPDQWSRDGRFIVYSQLASSGKRDLWVLPVGTSDRKSTAFLKTNFDVILGQLSPDSRWMAYTSDETGQREVYVRTFPSGEGVWPISTGGGNQPRWRGDGKELFYAGADGMMMAVPIRTVTGPKPSLEPGAPVPLFESHIIATPQTGGVFQYDVTADGKRFLVVTNFAGATPPLTVVVNWHAGLKK